MGNLFVIFDMDGVLINSEEIRKGMWREAAKQYNIALSEEELQSFVGSPDRENVEVFYQKGADRSVDILAEQLKAYEERQPELMRPYDGVLELLDFLDEKSVPYGVASTTHRPMVERSLSIAGILPCFRVMATGDEVRYQKPAPDIYLLAKRKLLIPENARAIAVEDSLLGVRAAKAANLEAFGYTSSYPERELFAAGADRVFSSFYDLQSALRDILGISSSREKSPALPGII
jgi:HAD superfamily hydrolase (TIGR01509 family)